MQDLTAKRLSTLHTRIFRMTRGRIGRRLVKNDMLLLTTKGRTTGNKHTVPLLYLKDGDDLVVFASWGGRDDHPEWYKNLTAEPRVGIQINGIRIAASATTADGDRRSRLWAQALAAYDGYGVYQDRTEREIPVVIVTPNNGSPKA